MRTEEVVKHFGSKIEIARALGIWHTAISAWGEYPPMGRQYELEVMTKGKLKASKNKELPRQR